MYVLRMNVRRTPYVRHTYNVVRRRTNVRRTMYDGRLTKTYDGRRTFDVLTNIRTTKNVRRMDDIRTTYDMRKTYVHTYVRTFKRTTYERTT